MTETRPSGTETKHSGPTPPFQFTLRQLLGAMGTVCLCSASVYWLGVDLGLMTFLVAISVATFIYLATSGKVTETLILSLTVGALLLLLLPAANDYGPGPSPRLQCSNHLKQIGLALQNYHDTYGSFPPAYIADANGKPMHSWRVLILPFAEQKPVYDAYRFDEPWDGPNNRQLHNQFPAYFCCPACYGKQPRGDTNYLAVVGPQTMWPGEKATKLSDIPGDPSDTIMVVEVANSGIHWMEPHDLHVLQMPMAVNPPRGQGISSPHHKVALAVFADGHTEALSNNKSPESLRAALTISVGEKRQASNKKEPPMTTTNPAPARPFQFTLRQLLFLTTIVSVAFASYYWLGEELAIVVLVLLGLLGAGAVLALALTGNTYEASGLALLLLFASIALLPSVGSRAPAYQMSCQNNLHNITIALQNYESACGCFPSPFIADASGKPMHSWRVLILPFIEQQALYEKYRFDEPWDGPNNRKLHSLRLPIFECPSPKAKASAPHTNYVAVVGKKTVWPTENTTMSRLADIVDGPSNTIHVVEVANSSIHWMEPRNLTFDEIQMIVNSPRGRSIGSHHPGGANASFADGAVRFFPNDIASETLRAALTRHGKDNDRLGPLFDSR